MLPDAHAQPYLQADEWLTREKAGFQGHPEYESAWLADFVDDYVERRGKDGRWADKTQHQRKGDFRALVKIAEDRHLRCKDLKAVHLRDYLATVKTASRGRTIKGLTKTMIIFGRHAGYFTRDQAELMDGITWTPPRGYQQAPTRREQSRLHGDISTGGEVLTYEQLDAWALKCQERWIHGSAFIHTCALLGTRSGEIRVLTADVRVANNGLGNLVDLENGIIRVRVRATTRVERKELPKLKKIRDIAIPRDAPAGFSLIDWLPGRIEDALAEQARGRNPKALIFPSLSGGSVRRAEHPQPRVGARRHRARLGDGAPGQQHEPDALHPALTARPVRQHRPARVELHRGGPPAAGPLEGPRDRAPVLLRHHRPDPRASHGHPRLGRLKPRRKPGVRQ